MPVRTIDTQLSRLIERRRRASTRPGRPQPKGPDAPPKGDAETTRLFNDWPFDFDVMAGTGRTAVHR